MVPANRAASTTPRLSLRPAARDVLVECVDDLHGRFPPSPSQRNRPSRIRGSKHASHIAFRPPRWRCAICQGASASEVQHFGMRAGGAHSVGPISHPWKRTATPMTSRGVRKPNCVVHDHARSPLSTQLWPPTMHGRRRRRPSVLGMAPRCQPATIPERGDTCRWASVRAVFAVQVANPGRCRRSLPMTPSQS